MNCLRTRLVPRSAVGPLLPFAVVRFRLASVQRGRRCPVGTHAVAVGAARRLRCGARPSVASQNSLRELRSLGSNSCDESVHEARCACRQKTCAARRHRNRPPPGTACRPEPFAVLAANNTSRPAKARPDRARSASEAPRRSGVACTGVPLPSPPGRTKQSHANHRNAPGCGHTVENEGGPGPWKFCNHPAGRGPRGTATA